MTFQDRTRQLFSRLSMLLLASAILVVSAHAQNNKGTIVGTVRDPNGAVVKDAKVTVINVETGETREATTSEDGTYSVPALDPGTYRVSIDAAGFQTVVVEQATLETNARLPVDANLTVGAVGGETVTVTSEAPLVESETSVRGDVITGREVTDLPIGQRNFTVLAQLSPGVTRPVSGVIGGGGEFTNGSPVGNSTQSTRFRESGGSTISANGARVTNNNFTLDGVDNNESQFGQIGIYPNPDAIAEFKVESSVPSAESGRAGGAIISTTFKSGTNEVHGTLYEFYQGRFASARITNRPNNTPNFVTHNFGGTVGGPIFLPRFGEGGPRLYDGRNQSFFFFSYNGQRNGTPAFGTAEDPVTIPTLKMRQGDFSELLQPSDIVTYNTVRGPVQAPRGTVFDRNGNPFPGNVVPLSFLSPAALNVFNSYPVPTDPGIVRNYRRNRSERATVDGYDIKIDHSFTQSNTFFGRYSKSENLRSRDNNFPLGSSPTGNDLPSGFGAGSEFGNSRQIALGDTQSFSPTVINDARAGYTRVEIGIANPGIFGTLGFDPNVASNLGVPGINSCGAPCTGIFGFGAQQSGAEGANLEFLGDGGPFNFLSNNFYFGDTLTVVRGNQLLKFGGDLRVRQNTQTDGNTNGNVKGAFVYTSGFENRDGFFSGRNNIPIGPNDSGSSYANFLLGYTPSRVNRGFDGGPFLLSSKEIAFFVQDDWKARPDLTLNLGLRYDIFTAPTERFDRQANFDRATRNLILASENGSLGRDLANTDKNNFGPRIGFAYSGFREDRKLVLRGGYGLLYSTDVSGVLPLTSNPPNGARYECDLPQIVAGNCQAPPNTNLDTGLPFPVQTAVSGTTLTAAQFNRTILFNDPNAKTSLFHQYNLTGQYEFAPSWLAEIAYVGSLGKNLLVVRNIGRGGGPGSREISNIDTVTITENVGRSNYNALQTKLEKRFSQGLSIISSYTWAHALDNTPGGFCIGGPGGGSCGPSNPVIGLDLDYGNSDLDVRHRFTFANVLDIPFGRGRRFGSDIPRAVDFLLGGFQLNNVIQIQSGPVYSVYSGGRRANITGDPFANLASGRELNRAAFTESNIPVFANDPDGPKYGTSGRNIFRGEPQEYWDASLFKNFGIPAISEAFNVQLRVQVYNLLNHINGYRPRNDLNDGEFGIDPSTQRARQLEFSVKILF